MSKEYFFERYKSFGEEPEEIKLRQSIRFATSKNHAELIKRLEGKKIFLEKIPFLTNGYWVKRSKVSVGASVEYLLGKYYVQEAAAQIPVEVLFSDPVKKGEVVLDCCAAPGGKTTQIASYHSGPLFAVEKMGKRIYSLKNQVERMGYDHVAVFKKDARFVHEFGVTFDRILVDAPCSGNFVIDKQWFGKRDIEMFLENQRKQKEILKSSFRCLKPGGVLVYSTCSLEPEENEVVVDWVLNKYSDIEIVDIDCIGDAGLTLYNDKKLHADVSKSRRLWPWKTGTQGFFIAKFRKKEDQS